MSLPVSIFLDDTLQIHERYQMLANYLQLRKPVLKTDLWNELETGWPIEADTFVEIDPVMVKNAKQKGLNAIEGNIEKLPVARQSITSLVDFSTLDHIPDPYPALKEYYRVLKSNSSSRCLLICWVGEKTAHKMENWQGLQYYFSEQLLTDKIHRAGFTIQWQEKFEGFGDHESSLKCYFLGKQPSIKRFFKKIKDILLHRFPIFQHDGKPDSLLKTQPIAIYNPQQIAGCMMFNIIPDQNSDSRKFYFTVTNEDPQIRLPEFNHPGQNIVIEIDMESPAETFLQVFYLSENNTDFTEEFSVTKKVFPGQNQIRALIPESKARGILRIDPGNTPGKYNISRIRIATIRDENTE